jgi:hypothetical protein
MSLMTVARQWQAATLAELAGVSQGPGVSISVPRRKLGVRHAAPRDQDAKGLTMRQVDIVAAADGVVAGMVVGVPIAVTSRLVGDPDSSVVGGSLVRSATLLQLTSIMLPPGDFPDER